MCTEYYVIVINVTATLFFFQCKKRGMYRVGGVGWDGLGVIYDLRTMFLCLIPVPLVFFTVVHISSSLV